MLELTQGTIYLNLLKLDFTQLIDEKITEIKHTKKARDQYMLLEAMQTDLKREGRAEGRIEGRIEGIKSLMLNLNCSIDQAMDLLNTPAEERQYFKDLLAKGV